MPRYSACAMRMEPRARLEERERRGGYRRGGEVLLEECGGAPSEGQQAGLSLPALCLPSPLSYKLTGADLVGLQLGAPTPSPWGRA